MPSAHTLHRLVAGGALLVSVSLPSAAASPDDAAILGLFDQVNTADVLTARLGATKGSSPVVRELGRMVARDHEGAQTMGRELAGKIAVVPLVPAGDRGLAELAATLESLHAKHGAEFDRAYLEHETAFHRGVIAAVRGTLLPAAKHPELRAMLESILPALEHHLAATEEATRQLEKRP